MQTRQHVPELMDDPSLDLKENLRARRGLSRLNTLSGAAHVIWKPIEELAEQRGLKTLRVLDIASGSADIPRRLQRIANRRGIALQIDGCDVSDAAIEHATAQSRAIGSTSIFFRLDATKQDIPSGYDVIMTSLFTHHLTDEETTFLLRNMCASTRHMVLINDLERSKLNLAMVWIATRIASSSPVVHFDGPASVRNSYTREELLQLAEQAGLTGATITEHFPCRMMLKWMKQ